MRTLKQISHDTYYKMENYHQITIDFVQEAEQLLDDSDVSTEEDRKERLSNLELLSGMIGLTLEIFNPSLEIEIRDLRDVKSLLEIRIGKYESLVKR